MRLSTLKALKQPAKSMIEAFGGKKIKGLKRHIVVNTMGNLLSIVVHAANIHYTKSGRLVIKS